MCTRHHSKYITTYFNLRAPLKLALLRFPLANMVLEQKWDSDPGIGLWRLCPEHVALALNRSSLRRDTGDAWKEVKGEAD